MKGGLILFLVIIGLVLIVGIIILVVWLLTREEEVPPTPPDSEEEDSEDEDEEDGDEDDEEDDEDIEIPTADYYEYFSSPPPPPKTINCREVMVNGNIETICDFEAQALRIANNLYLIITSGKFSGSLVPVYQWTLQNNRLKNIKAQTAHSTMTLDIISFVVEEVAPETVNVKMVANSESSKLQDVVFSSGSIYFSGSSHLDYFYRLIGREATLREATLQGTTLGIVPERQRDVNPPKIPDYELAIVGANTYQSKIFVNAGLLIVTDDLYATSENYQILSFRTASYEWACHLGRLTSLAGNCMALNLPENVNIPTLYQVDVVMKDYSADDLTQEVICVYDTFLKTDVIYFVGTYNTGYVYALFNPVDSQSAGLLRALQLPTLEIGSSSYFYETNVKITKQSS